MPQEIEFKPVLDRAIDITPESARNTAARNIRVKGRLKNMREWYMQVSATFKTQENTVLALVDRALRVNGLVPRWVIEELIDNDGNIQADGVFLDGICGAEALHQLAHIKRLGTSYYLDGFTPAVYLVGNKGATYQAVGCDLSRLHLSDYSKLVIGVQFTPVESSIDTITRKWFESHGLSSLGEGDVELSPLTSVRGRQIAGAYSLTEGLVEVDASDIPERTYRLGYVYSKDGKKISDCCVAGDSLIAVADRRLDRRSIYRASDTYLDGELHKQSEVYMVTIPGLERSLLRKFKIIDPRDIGILIETEEQIRDGEATGPVTQRTESGQGRLSGTETRAYPGMRYDVVVMIQGVYDRGDFRAGLM